MSTATPVIDASLSEHGFRYKLHFLEPPDGCQITKRDEGTQTVWVKPDKGMAEFTIKCLTREENIKPEVNERAIGLAMLTNDVWNMAVRETERNVQAAIENDWIKITLSHKATRSIVRLMEFSQTHYRVGTQEDMQLFYQLSSYIKAKFPLLFK